MNIFRLDNDPFQAAIYHNDKHVIKMILETAQLLSTAHVMLDSPQQALKRIPNLMRPTHITHPCSIWVRQSAANYEWTYQLLWGLLSEYRTRYRDSHIATYGHERQHQLLSLAEALVDKPYCIGTCKEQTPAPQCMPIQFKDLNDPVRAYRTYYFYAKAHLAQWRAPAKKPEWWIRMEERDAVWQREQLNGVVHD